MSEVHFRQMRQARILARYARAGAQAATGCAHRWQRLQREFAQGLAAGMRAQLKLFRSLAASGERAVADEGMKLHEAIGQILGADRDFRGHLAAMSLILDELVAFERGALTEALARRTAGVSGFVPAMPVMTYSPQSARLSA